MATTPNYVLLQRTTVNIATAGITLSAIPQTGYTDLKVVISARSTANGGQNVYLRMNGVSSGYTDRFLYGNGTGAGSTNSGNTNAGLNTAVPGADFTANTFSNGECYIFNYLGSQLKSTSGSGVTENNSSTSYQQTYSVTNGITDPVSSLYFFLSSGNFAVGSSISIYGIAALGTTPVAVPKASGGDIVVNDGTYWYHAFLSSGTFTPQTTLSCSALVVAGGGAGGANGGGGGGAGGAIVLSSTSLTAQNYVVTIGAGGSSSLGVGNNGSNTVFGSNTAIGGGKGGVFNQAGSAGGSGGGGAMSAGASVTGGSATSGQGFAGGTGSSSYSSNTGGGAGGGGAGAVGANAVNANPMLGVGGVGVSGATYSFINGAGAAMNVGQLSGGNYYFAGGGSGGPSGFSVSNYGGLGGGANFNASATVNTGGGGGGGQAYGSDNPGNGGSGIVIVRYTMA